MIQEGTLDDYFTPMSASPSQMTQMQGAPRQLEGGLGQAPAPQSQFSQMSGGMLGRPMSQGSSLGRPLGHDAGGGSSNALKMAGTLLPVVGALGQTGDILEQRRDGQITAMQAAGYVTAIIAGLAIRFGAGYLVGKALAPDEESESQYAWGGAIASTFLGTIGLAVQAIVANKARSGE